MLAVPGDLGANALPPRWRHTGEGRHAGLRRRVLQITAPETDDTRISAFWRCTLLIGVGSFEVGAIGVLAYVRGSPAGPHRATLQEGAFVAIAVAAIVYGVVRRASTRVARRVVLFGCVTAVGLITAGAALDGGSSSPLTLLLVVPILLSSVALPPAAVGLVSVGATVAYIGLALSHSGWRSPQDQGDVMALVLIGLVAVASAANRRGYERRIRRLATRDGLTGCLTRRAFAKVLDTEAQRAERHHRPMSIMIVDVDHLKEINDSGGHAAGDRALRFTAHALLTGIRRGDAVGRLGGDEFAIVLPETDPRQAATAADRLRQSLSVTGARAAPTVSIGIATWIDGPLDPADLLLRADSALYSAKALGRDRSVAALSPSDEGQRTPQRRTSMMLPHARSAP
jgi:diguanylate cyclase (GGDEF)-like protein